MTINLTRNASGTILSNGTPIILRGGHYHIFKDDDQPERALVRAPSENLPGLPLRVVYNNAEPCQVDNPRLVVEKKYWTPEPWSIFSYMNQFGSNFLRLWLMNGTLVGNVGGELKPLDLTPFVGKLVGGKWKWQVYDAVVNNVWNNQYFRKLNAFVTAAENAGIVVQISLFNYADMTRRFDGGDYRAWCRSPWNPTLSEHPTSLPNWANENLVNAGGSFACADDPNNPAENARQSFFVAPTNNLRKVQQALVTKTVQTLAARTNVIYEIMNEPRGTARQNAKFYSAVTSWILSAAGTKRPLISVNATKPKGTELFDVDDWHDNPSIPHYDKIDAISYHGLTGYPESTQSVCERSASLPPVDLRSVQTRFNAHRSKHGGKSLIYCTDAARTGIHKLKDADGNEHELQMRDGQIFTNYPNVNSDPPEVQRKMSDLQNWAFWCFSVSVAYPGKVHFQNHSLYQLAYNRIKEAMDHALALPRTSAPAGAA